MYYPIQIPYALNNEFNDTLKYTEKVIPGSQDFVICLWEFEPLSNEKKIIDNIIITDGCIDLIIDFDNKNVGYAGMTKTVFDHKIILPSRSFGFRLRPGAFHAITKIPAMKVMDSFLPIKNIDNGFNSDNLFSLSISEAKLFMIQYLNELVAGKTPSQFMVLFEMLVKNIPASVNEIYQITNYSPRQCQRLFLKNFGLSPQLALCILRFQKCLELLISGNLNPGDILDKINYYDQSHMINDFKRHLGVTAHDLINKYSK